MGTLLLYNVPSKVPCGKRPAHAKLGDMPVTPEARVQRRTPRKRVVNSDRVEELLRQASDIVLSEGFTSVTMDEVAQRLGCSKATLYSVAGTKEQMVQTITRRFFVEAAAQIEAKVATESDSRQRIRTYLSGVGSAMRRHSPAFYDDMVSYAPTA